MAIDLKINIRGLEIWKEDLEVAGRLEGLGADGAGELALAVDVLAVAVHAAGAAEALAAVGARVRKLARVLPHVDLQPVLVDETAESKMATRRLPIELSRRSLKRNIDCLYKI